MNVARPGFRGVLPGFGWPETIVITAVVLQILISLLFIIYFLLINSNCTLDHCEAIRLIGLAHFNEEAFLRVLKSDRSLYMFYNVFAPASYMYVITTALLLGLCIIHARRLMVLPRKLVLLAFLALYLYYLLTTIIIPPWHSGLTQLHRSVIEGSTAAYFIMFCALPLITIALAIILSPKGLDNNHRKTSGA